MKNERRRAVQPRWGKEFNPPRRDLEAIEKRQVLIEGGKLSDESVTQKIAADLGWNPRNLWQRLGTEMIIFFLTYCDLGAAFLCGVLAGLSASLFR